MITVIAAAAVAGVVSLAIWTPRSAPEDGHRHEAAASNGIPAEWAALLQEAGAAREDLMRRDAIILGRALEDIESFFDDYATGIEAFVDELYSLGGKWNLLRHLSRDLLDLPDEARTIFEEEWTAAIGDAGFWRGVRSGKILEVIAAVALHGYSFPAVERYVGAMWRDHFDRRIDIDRAIAARIDRLRYELTANRNRFALDLQGLVLKIENDTERMGLVAVAIPVRLEQEMAGLVTGRGAAMASQAIGVEILALAGSEAAAIGSLIVLRSMSSQAASAATKTLAASIAARVGARTAVWMGSRFATLGTAILVAVAVDYGLDRYFRSRMTGELTDYLAAYREAMWLGTPESPGLYPQLTDAFVAYHDNLSQGTRRALEQSLYASVRRR